MSAHNVYADCAASCPPLPCAVDAFTKWAYANPNSVHSLGRDARGDLEWARETIAFCINAKPEQIAFTPSATAACRTAIAYLNITIDSPYEHKAVEEAVGWNRMFLGGDGHSQAHMLANNETGVRYDSAVMELAKDNVVFCDATAAVGQIPVDVQKLGVHALAAGAHKFGGFPGIGFLYLRDGITDESTYPGTPPVALAVAMASALEYRCLHMDANMVYLAAQTGNLVAKIAEIDGEHINLFGKPHLSNILSVRFDGVNARELLTALDVRGVYASAGAACSADEDEPSRVLLASGLTEEQALSTIRLSFCPETTPDEFSFVADALREAVAQLRSMTSKHTQQTKCPHRRIVAPRGGIFSFCL